MRPVASNAIDLIRSRFPDLVFETAAIVEDGWDSLVLDLDGEWIVRVPRRHEVAEWIERERRLLPELAPTLPVAVPHFELVARDGIVCVGYRKLHGSPASSGVDRRGGRDLGRFLVALHGFPLDRARELGVPFFTPASWRERFQRLCDDFEQRVGPLLSEDERRRAEALFACVPELEFEPALVHADLGPEHVLCRAGRVVAVIDWSDACVGDPALDLAWCLNGTPAEVAEEVAELCAAGADVRRRALFYHRLGPWYELVHGADSGRPELVARGLEGVRARLSERS